MSDLFPLIFYLGLVILVTLATLAVSGLFPAVRTTDVKYLPYESGIQTETHLLQQRYPLHHYLVALIFLVFDVEVIFLYPWAAVARTLGPFAFYEMIFFLVALLVGFAYVWQKRGLEWE